MNPRRENGSGPKSEAVPNPFAASYRQVADRFFDDSATPPHRRWGRLVSRSLLLDCGCRENCHCEILLTDRELDAWVAAARIVLATADVVPAVPVEVRRALWRRGGEDRELVEFLHARSVA